MVAIGKTHVSPKLTAGPVAGHLATRFWHGEFMSDLVTILANNTLMLFHDVSGVPQSACVFVNTSGGLAEVVCTIAWISPDEKLNVLLKNFADHDTPLAHYTIQWFAID